MSTDIEWTDATWNPTTGCDRVSPGCDHCYAMTLAKRLKGMGSAKYQRDGDPRTSGPGFGVSVHPDSLDLPLRWRKPRKVFVNSMSDLFHEQVPDEFIAQVFAIMAAAPEHTFQILTKRHGRMRSWLCGPAEQQVRDVLAGWECVGLWMDSEHRAAWLCPGGLSGRVSWPLPNVWLGVSVEDQKWADIRIPALLDTPAAVRFLSCEPLLGPVELEFVRYVDSGCGGCSGILSPAHEPACGVEPGKHWGIDWVIAGGESGHGARPMHPDWARSLRDRCTSAGVPFLFKQWGGHTPKAGGRELDGRTWDEYPQAVIG